MKRKTIAVIPAFDEKENISRVIMEAAGFVDEVVVVDDGSSDSTADVAEKAGAKVLKHVINMGKGAALKTGCEYALDKGAEYIISIDGDGQHEPGEIPRFIKELDRGADIVFGARELKKGSPFVLRIGNLLINYMTRLIFKIDLHDTQCGYRAFTSAAYKKIRWRSADYSMESEMVVNCALNSMDYREISIRNIYHDCYKGTGILDGIRIVINLIWWKISR